MGPTGLKFHFHSNQCRHNDLIHSYQMKGIIFTSFQSGGNNALQSANLLLAPFANGFISGFVFAQLRAVP